MPRYNDLSPLQERFLEEIFKPEHKGCYRRAADAAGYAKSTTVDAIVKPIAQEIIERAQRYIALNAPKSAMKLVGVLDAPAEPGTSNMIQAAEKLLDRAGIAKQDKVQVEHTIPDGLLILPAKLPVEDDNSTETE